MIFPGFCFVLILSTFEMEIGTAIMTTDDRISFLLSRQMPTILFLLSKLSPRLGDMLRASKHSSYTPDEMPRLKWCIIKRSQTKIQCIL